MEKETVIEANRANFDLDTIKLKTKKIAKDKSESKNKSRLQL